MCFPSNHKIGMLHPGPCGSAGWSIVPYTQMLQIWPLVGECTGGNQLMFLSYIDVSPSVQNQQTYGICPSPPGLFHLA